MKTTIKKRITLKTGLKVYHLTNGNKTVVLNVMERTSRNKLIPNFKF